MHTVTHDYNEGQQYVANAVFILIKKTQLYFLAPMLCYLLNFLTTAINSDMTVCRSTLKRFGWSHLMLLYMSHFTQINSALKLICDELPVLWLE